MKIKLGNKETIHFVGIGGIGMSGLAIIMKGLGFKIQGSDLSFSKNIERLKNNRIKVFLGHREKNILNSTILVISSAIKKNNPELIKAKKSDFSPHKCDYLNHSYNIDSANKTNPPVISNIHVWLFL